MHACTAGDSEVVQIRKKGNEMEILLQHNSYFAKLPTSTTSSIIRLLNQIIN